MENKYITLESGKKILSLEQIKKEWPKLKPGGFSYFSRIDNKWAFSSGEEEITDRPKEYEAIANFLDKNISKRKTVYKGCSSYHYKHIVEDCIHHYVANGMMIAAAIGCGYKMHYNNFCGPNAFFAWSLKSWEPFEYPNNKEGHSGPPLD